jgi:membrane associated rhomboid family serine protease
MVVYEVHPYKKRNIFRIFSLTTNLIIANIFVFVLFFIFLAFGVNLEPFIALDPFYIFNGGYFWTFLTSMFMHGGIFHLFVNMFSLFFVGSLVEKLLGRKRYFWLYLTSGLFAGLLFVGVYFLSGDFNLHVPAVGASGALFGLIGLLMVLTPNLPVYMMFIPIPIKMKYAAPGMLLVLWLASAAWNLPIGNVAHLGGLIAGLVYGVYLKKKFPRKTNYINRRFS